jgi:cob(I)alamin adenosyltransferase
MARRRDEPVRLDRIYTRGGDAGDTSLGDGSRVSKLDPRIGAAGAVDELSSLIGVVLAGGPPAEIAAVLEPVQNELFDLGADLSVPVTDATAGRLRIEQPSIDELERLIDELNEGLPMLRSFILPGGDETAARLHVARAVCRRAEREAIAAARQHPLNPLGLVYLNRLSDLLFVLARVASKGNEPLWRPGGSRR